MIIYQKIYYKFDKLIKEFVELYKTTICPCEDEAALDTRNVVKMFVILERIKSMTGVCLNIKDIYYQECKQDLVKKILSTYYKYLYDVYNQYNSDADELFSTDAVKCCLDKYAQNYGASIDITIGVDNLPPNNIDNGEFSTESNTTYTLTSALFTNGYSDPENDPPYSVKILTLPSKGILLFNGNPVSPGDDITISDIDSGLFVYTSFSDTGEDSFQFTISDTGSHQFF